MKCPYTLYLSLFNKRNYVCSCNKCDFKIKMWQVLTSFGFSFKFFLNSMFQNVSKDELILCVVNLHLSLPFY